MPITTRYVSALNKLFRTKPVALLEDLRDALKTRSRTTIFRVLRAAGYRTSYSHAGRYYTLERIPKFDDHGLWLYGDVGFSKHGSLRATVIHLVETSPGGQTHEELQQLLRLRVHDTLRFLVGGRQLTRRRFQDAYVYLSSKPERAAQQWAQRQQLAAVAQPPELGHSQIIPVLLEVIRHPADDVEALSERLRRLGQKLTSDQVEAILERYDLKKTVQSRSRRWRR